MDRRPHIIVFGNEKGGSGKSTTAMHIIMGLMDQGLRVACLDLDSRQRTLSRYIENRQDYARDKGLQLPMPALTTIESSEESLREAAEIDERSRFEGALEAFSSAYQAIVIDCPGRDSHLSRLAHTYADTLITPLNDSFVDLDLLARVDPETLEIEGPSLYAEMVWDSRKARAMRDRGSIDWIVLRNRVASLEARNTQNIRTTLTNLSRRIGFRFVTGFGERVIYKELFLKGLTLLDLCRGEEEGKVEEKLTMSQLAARQELRRLVEDLHLPVRDEVTLRHSA